MKIAPKLFIPIVAMSLALLAIVGVALWLQSEASKSYASARIEGALSLDASEVRALSRAIQRDALKRIEASGAKADSLEKSITTRSAELLMRAKRVVDSPLATEEMKHTFLPLQSAVMKEIATVVDLAQGRDKDAARHFFTSHVEPAEKAASKITDGFLEAAVERANHLAAANEALEKQGQLSLVLAAVAVLLTTGVGAGLLITRGVVGPIRLMQGSIEKISHGDYVSPVGGLERKDEFGEVARAVEGFRSELAKGDALRAEQEVLREEAAMQRQASEAERARSARDVEVVVTSVAAALRDLASGDLTVSLDGTFPPQYSQLKVDFNLAISQLKSAMRSIAQSVGALHNGSNDINEATNNLSGRTERQAAALEEASAALAQVTVGVKATSANALHARDVVMAARTEADLSGNIVNEAVMAMGGIQKSSTEIGMIVGLIDEIAFQTNLLALNAGVEAARAGETGRGFAVVATEVRALAQRSAEAAKEIKALISSSSAQVASGVELVGQTGATLSRIVQHVVDITSIVSGIANSAQEQAVALDQINASVSHMDQITQQNAAMVEESTAASTTLADEASSLLDQVGRFRIGTGYANDHSPSRAA